MGGSALLAFYPMDGATAKKAVVRGTLSLCSALGGVLRQARAAHADPVAAVASHVGAEVVFNGRIRDIERRTVGGFARGTARFEGVEEWAGHTMLLEFQNEFLIAYRDDEVLVTTPDLITVLDAENGQPVTSRPQRTRIDKDDSRLAGRPTGRIQCDGATVKPDDRTVTGDTANEPTLAVGQRDGVAGRETVDERPVTGDEPWLCT